MKKIFIPAVSTLAIVGGAVIFSLSNFSNASNSKEVKKDDTLSNLKVAYEMTNNEQTKEDKTNQKYESVLENLETTVLSEDENDTNLENVKSSQVVKENTKTTVESQKASVIPSNDVKEKTPEVENQVDNKEVIEPSVDVEKQEENQDVPEQNDDNQKTEEPKEEVKNYASLVEQEVQKIVNANSVHYILRHEGYLNTKDEIWFNKSANRRLGIFDDEVKEYVEGIPGRQVIDSKFSSYYYQDIWRLKSETGVWEKQPSLYSGFGISTLSLLKNIKFAEFVGDRPFYTYVATIDKEVANKAAENLYNRVNTFANDIKLYVSIDKRTGDIIHISSNWKNTDFTNPSQSFTLSLVIADVNKTNVERPKELKNVVITDRAKPDEFTETKKQEYARLIERAYANTRDANSLTYTLNGSKTMAYNKGKNEALLTEGSSQTYYKGDNEYIDYDYVETRYQQNSWTKSNGVWAKNVMKHTTFTPQELFFLNHIFTVKKVEKENDMTTYTVEVLKYDANLAYSHVYGVNDKFSGNIEFTVSVDDAGYVRKMHIDVSDYNMDLIINKVNSTEIEKPQDLVIE